MISNGNELALESKRISFGKTKFPAEYPDFLEIQLKSFQEFFQLETTPENRMNEGLYKVFKENFPISDARSIFQLEFLDYFVDPPRYSMEECVQRGLTFHVPLKAKLKLSCNDVEHVDFQTIVQDVFLGNIPYMTPRGTFVINGAERVVVSQLHRSPGVFFGQSVHPNGTKIYSARVIPFKGAWMEFATDINTVMYAYIDRKKKFPVTTLLRAIGFDSDKAILDIFDLADIIPANREELQKSIGRKLAARVLRSWTEDFVDEDTGEVVTIERNEIILERDSLLDDDNIDLILDQPAMSSFFKKKTSIRIILLFIIPCKKIRLLLKWRRFSIFTDNLEVLILPMRKLLVELSINCSFLIKDIILVRLADIKLIVNLILMPVMKILSFQRKIS